MESTHLGRSGLKVSRLAPGTMNFGWVTKLAGQRHFLGLVSEQSLYERTPPVGTDCNCSRCENGSNSLIGNRRQPTAPVSGARPKSPSLQPG
jgi:hypothetical protein